jgi:hypothetical protein
VDNVSDIQRVGFESYLNSNFQLDLDEKDGLIIKDKEGKLIPNPNKAGSFLSPVEILDQIADKNGLKKKNNVDTRKNVTFAERKPAVDDRKSRLSPTYLKRTGQA